MSGVVTYILMQGVTKFYMEALGTTVLTTTIIWQLLPVFLKTPFFQMLNYSSLLPLIICSVPPLLLIVAVILGVKGFVLGALRPSCISFAITAVVFTVYHFVQHLGFSYAGS
ncbi:MAG: hypothetical protein ABI615_09020 [Chthoniobacterales bacterium]